LAARCLVSGCWPSCSVRFRVGVSVSDSVSASVSFVVNIMFEITDRRVPLALGLYIPAMAIHSLGLVMVALWNRVDHYIFAL